MKNRDIVIVAVIGITFIPFYKWFPLWLMILLYLLLSLRVILFLKKIKLYKPIKIGLTLSLFLAIIIAFKGYLGLESGASLLAVLTVMKTFELSSSRDKTITIMAGIFLSFSLSLFSQTILQLAYIIFLVWVYFGLMILINIKISEYKHPFKISALIIIQSIPLAIILFLFFPRFPGSLIGLNPSPRVGITGIDPILSPGSISKLVISNKIAFRAKFEQKIPSQRLYWRTIVLWDYMGESKWLPGKIAYKKLHYKYHGEKTGKFNYTIFLQPTFNSYLPVLDFPITTPPLSTMYIGGVIKYKNKITKVISYTLSSYPFLTDSHMDKLQKKYALYIDKNHNLKTQILVKRLKSQSNTPEDFLKKVITYFKNNNFYYTLNPPLLAKKDPIDDFIFRKKMGFCEHYAQAMAWMLRCAGIPTRIVLGFVGGENNPLGDYIIVKYANAHAWIEAYINKKWKRIDPIALILPKTIGSTNLLGNTSNQPPKKEGWSFFVSKIKLGWDAINYFWQRWVVSFSSYKQTKIWEKIGLGGDFWKTAPLAIIIIISALLIGVFIYMFFPPLLKTSSLEEKVKKIFDGYIQKLNKLDIPIKKFMGPMDIAKKVAEKRPHLKDRAYAISNLYMEIRYKEKYDIQKIKLLKNLIKNFKP